MVRCSDCGKSFKQHSGENWNDNKCKKCWNKVKELTYVPIKMNARIFDSPVDFYLDLYTLREMENMKN